VFVLFSVSFCSFTILSLYPSCVFVFVCIVAWISDVFTVQGQITAHMPTEEHVGEGAETYFMYTLINTCLISLGVLPSCEAFKHF